MRSLLAHHVYAFAFCVTIAADLIGQCQTAWAPGGSLPGTDGTVNEMEMWDPDGAGPLGMHLVVGGSFNWAGGGPAANVAMMDLVTKTWSAIGPGVAGEVRDLAVGNNGDLIIAWAPGLPGSGLARWDGSQLLDLNAPSGGLIDTVLETSSGELWIGGWYPFIGANVRRWNGSSWDFVGIQQRVYDLIEMPNGDIVAATNEIGAPMRRWNGTSWSTMGSLQGQGFDAQLMPNGDVVAAGDFTSFPGFVFYGAARWDGATWRPIGSNNWPTAYKVAHLGNGNLVTCNVTGKVLYWNGTVWTQLGPSGLDVNTVIGDWNGSVFAGAWPRIWPSFQHRASVMHWSGSQWQPGSPGFSDDVRTFTYTNSGELVVGGLFLTAANVVANCVARFDGNDWHPLGSGIDSPTSQVTGLVTMPNGNIIASGAFTSAGGVPANNIARWDGNAWHAMGNGSIAQVDDVIVRKGTLLAPIAQASGGIRINEWNGISWTPLPGSPAGFYSDLELDGDDLWVTTSHSLHKWDGTTWTQIPTPFGPIDTVAILPSGDPVVGGAFGIPSIPGIGNIARWDGTQWQPLSTGMNGRVRALTALPNGDLVAGGLYATAGSTQAYDIARWDGTTWHAMEHIIGTLSSYGVVFELEVGRDGELLVGGNFLTAGPQSSANFARWVPACPASTMSYGSGCSGAGGQDTLTHDTDAWAGSTFRANATGMATNALCAPVFGYSQLALPLPSVLPGGLPGCTVHSTGDLYQLALPNNGTLSTSLAIPNAPSFAGMHLHHYVLTAELDPAGNVTAITSTNGLRLTLGTY